VVGALITATEFACEPSFGDHRGTLSYMGAKMQLRRKFCLYICVGISVASVLAAEEPIWSADDASRAQGQTATFSALPARTRIDLGSCRSGEAVKASVYIRNDTRSSLTLRSIDPDCGCLAVVPDQRHFDQGEMIRLSLHLSSSNKIAKLRRSIRFQFHESDAPFVLDVDVRVSGPMRLGESIWHLAKQDSVFQVEGHIEEAGIRVTRIDSVRGAFVISGAVRKTSDAFHFAASPTFSFGDAGDLVRVQYRDATDQLKTLDLPIVIRFTAPIRFLPSTLNLGYQRDRWRGKARMIISPGKLRTDVQNLRFVANADLDSAAPAISVHVDKVSSVLANMEIVIPGYDPAKKSGLGKKEAFPKSLTVLGPQNQVLGILYLARNEGE